MNKIFICLYHPRPSATNSSHRQFIEDLECLIEHHSEVLDRVIILGDFNIHFDSLTDTYSKSVKTLLHNNDLTNLVTTATHCKGHILDWVVASETFAVSVDDLCLLDHYTINFRVALHLGQRKKKIATKRNTRSIDGAALNADIRADLEANHSAQGKGRADMFEDILRRNLENHAPLKTRETTDRQPAPRIKEKVRETQRRRRTAERKWHKSRTASDRQAYKQAMDSVKATIIKEKKSHFARGIKSSRTSKGLYSVVNEVCRKLSSPVLPKGVPKKELPDRFSRYFSDKISKLRQELDHDAEDPSTETAESVPKFSGDTFRNFKEITEQEVKNILTASPSMICSLDPIPTKFLKTCLDSSLPEITNIFNQSLSTVVVPDSFKKAIVIPLIKEPDLDPEDLKHHRPVSNLSFMSKVLEKKIVLHQLKDHLKRNNLIEKFQSAYRNWHSTETAFLRIVNDILLSCDDGNISVLTLLDLSAAFDTIDHAILFERLSTNIGLDGNVLASFKSYLSGRTQSVKIDEHTSDDMPLKYGVPQDSVLGPVLYTLYTLSIAETIKSYSVGYHMYAHDTQLYACGAPQRIGEVCKNIQDSCESVEAWMKTNKLRLNIEKTVVMYCGSQQNLKLIDNAYICFGNAKIIPSLTAKNLGVFLDSQMNMEKQVNSIVKTISYVLRNLAKIEKYLDDDSIKSIVTTLILSRLDYCNSLLAGLPDSLIKKLQRVQNNAATLVLGINCFEKIDSKEILIRLHWLPIKARVDYKIALLCFNGLNSRSPDYVRDLLRSHAPTRSLRSSETSLLQHHDTLLMQAYAPTTDHDEEEIEHFYDDLSEIIKTNKAWKDKLLVVGDFNAKVGKERGKGIVGPFGL
ncbi:reverse transcriptase-like protein [Elysia marginata]|uniref:Reverse transcriptase-like protein n=1 Tax=Elysia marginata TaxID=1093978 RepID=A0AAV4JAL1_9GAST|nr:reverse transcriptase-like protein [Elysia marginata]